MHKRAGELDQSSVKSVIGAGAVAQPEFLQHLVGLEELGAIETLKITEVMRLQWLAQAFLNQRGDL